MPGMPKFVERGGEMVLRQPIACDRTTMYNFLVDADWNALVRLCDQAFRGPSGGEVVVRPIVPAVMVVAADIKRGHSKDPVDASKGWCCERDLGFWVPVARGRFDDGDPDDFEIEQIGWYQPYLFIDNAAAVFVGRETYGFQKAFATCTMPSDATHPSRFAVDTLVIDSFQPTTEAKVEELYRLERADGGVLGALETSIGSFAELVLETTGRVARHFFGRSGLPMPTWALVKNLYASLKDGLVPMFFLRQFRDVAEPDRACYQAIIEAAADMTAWRAGGFLDEHVLTIRECASHPIAKDLGLAPGPIETGFGFWADFDFDIRAGRELWRAP
jgi:hypothetical protein